MRHLLHLMFRCDGDVMESDVFVGVFGGSKRGLSRSTKLKLLSSRSQHRDGKKE